MLSPSVGREKGLLDGRGLVHSEVGFQVVLHPVSHSRLEKCVFVRVYVCVCMCMCMCECVCVCARERERETKRGGVDLRR